MRQTISFALILFAFASCSKQSSVKEPAVKNEPSPTLSVNSEDAKKKYAGIVCTENNRIGTECSVPGTSCKYYECDANTNSVINSELSGRQISEYSAAYAQKLVASGKIDPSYAPEIISLMKKALVENNRRVKK